MRTNLVRVVAGGMLLSAAASALAVTTFQHHAHAAPKTAACAVSAAICLVAFYHYAKIIDLRRHSHTTADQHVDAVRYSDWLVTLPALALEINLVQHANDTDTALSQTLKWALLLAGVVLCGGLGRFGTHDFANSSEERDDTPLSLLAGVIAYGVAWGCLIIIIVDAIHKEYNLTFIIPWTAYGAVAIGVALANNLQLQDHQTLGYVKDVSYGLLDLWSKAVLGLWTTAKAMEIL
jgi:Kef-type K+ transport system membrane component KefB